MLDTNAASAVIKGPTDWFRSRLLDAPVAALCISAVTEGELRFGLAKRPEAIRLAEAAEAFMSRMDILSWDSAAARRYGALRATLDQAGTPLSNLDTLIAAHALAVGAHLVTSDKAFRRVEGLVVADWNATAG
jgi:tRNA(fMet)-specific endonuclease VapC